MADTPSRPMILALEDEVKWQSVIFGVADNMGFDCEVATSVKEFTEKFVKGRYAAVILDNRVTDGAALEIYDLHQWVRKEDPDVPMALNSLSEVADLAKEVGAENLCKDAMRLRDFFYKLRNKSGSR